MSDAFPAYIKGQYDQSTFAVSIDEVAVDTSSFYA